MKLFQFLKPPTESRIHQIIHILSLAVIVGGGIFYTYFAYEAISWETVFPTGNKLQAPMWLMHLSLRILCLWMPFNMLLMRWNPQPIIVLIVYIVGCVIAIIFSFTATGLIDEFKKPGLIKEEYSRLVQNSIDHHSTLPEGVRLGASSINCCGWYGPIDYGTKFNISDKVDTDFDFIKEVEECYGHTFTVTKSSSSNSLIYKRGPKTKLLEGCGPKYKMKAQTICYLISIAGIFIDLIGLLFIFLCVVNFIINTRSSRTHAVSPVVSDVIDPHHHNNIRLGTDRRNHSLPPAPPDYIVRLPSRHSDLSAMKRE